MKNTPLACQIVFLMPLLFIFAACPNQTENSGETHIEKSDYTRYQLGRLGLDEDVEWQILQSYQKKLKSNGINVAINDVWVEKYYGPYCPSYKWYEWCESWTYPDNGILDAAGLAVFNAGWDTFSAENQTLFAVVLGYEGWDTEQRIRMQQGIVRPLITNGNHIFLWDDEQLSPLEDRWHWLFLEDFLSITNQQNGLELETQLRIQEDYCKSMRSSWPSEQYKELRIQYLGTYNGYIILITSIKSNAGVGKYTVGDVHFTGGRMNEDIFAWKEGEIFELTDLYEQELITHEDLVEIAYEFGGIE
jgi:hypothetical protein